MDEDTYTAYLTAVDEAEVRHEPELQRDAELAWLEDWSV